MMKTLEKREKKVWNDGGVLIKMQGSMFILSPLFLFSIFFFSFQNKIKSFRDGRAFLALIHTFNPSLVMMEDLYMVPHTHIDMLSIDFFFLEMNDCVFFSNIFSFSTVFVHVFFFVLFVAGGPCGCIENCFWHRFSKLWRAHGENTHIPFFFSSSSSYFFF
jgi:hypothetical protein